MGYEAAGIGQLNGKTSEAPRSLRINRFPYGNLRYPYRYLKQRTVLFS
jgi:hypothetical protein